MKRYRFTFLVKIWLTGADIDYNTFKIDMYGTSKHDALFHVMKEIDLDLISFVLDNNDITCFYLEDIIDIKIINN